MAEYYGFVQADSGLLYAAEVLRLSEKLNYSSGKFMGYRGMFFSFNCKGNYPKALEAALNIQKLGEIKNAKGGPTFPYYFLGLLNLEMRDYSKARDFFYQAISNQLKSHRPQYDIYYVYSHMANLYRILNQKDSAMWYATRGYELGLHSDKDVQRFFALACSALGKVYQKSQKYDLAESYFRRGIAQSQRYSNIYFLAQSYTSMAKLFQEMNLKDSAIHYGNISLRLCQDHNYGDFTQEASTILASVYESEHKPDSSLKYLKIMVAAKDSVFSQTKGQQFQQFAFNEIQRQQEITAAEERDRNRAKLYTLLTALGIFLLVAFLLYRNNRQKQKDKIKIEKAYDELKLDSGSVGTKRKNGFAGRTHRRHRT